MKQQNGSKLYWKDALRQVQTELDDEEAISLPSEAEPAESAQDG